MVMAEVEVWGHGLISITLKGRVSHYRNNGLLSSLVSTRHNKAPGMIGKVKGRAFGTVS